MSREIGSLRALSNGESQYVGSSSGVFFINTVRRAFSTAVATTPIAPSPSIMENGPSLSNPSPEDCIVGTEEQIGPGVPSNEAGGSNESPHAYEPSPHSHLNIKPIDDMSQLPSYAVAKQLLMTYFQMWHALVPFLHGPSCFEELDALYSDDRGEQSRTPRSVSHAIIFRCIFNIAILDRPDLPPLAPLEIRSAVHLLPALSLVTLQCDLISIQALLSAQLYFVATMSLRAASTVGGLVFRSIVKSGLHRCPFRYSHLSLSDRDMRKRVFWSAYALDRFLSQSLGHPLGIQDSDTDVCRPGSRDLHEPVPQSGLSIAGAAPEETILHLPATHPKRREDALDPDVEDDDNSGADNTADAASDETEAISRHRREIQSVLASHVHYCELVGRLLETFHKSIHVRSADFSAVLSLKTDIDAWGNSLAHPYLRYTRTHEDRYHLPIAPTSALAPDPTVFPFVAHQHLLLLVNRPSLSLEPKSVEFRSALQMCIGAGRAIIRTLGIYSEMGNTLFWPGYMSAVWMSGLVMAYASQLKLYRLSKAIVDISAALQLLKIMMRRWRMAQHCHSVLSTLLSSLQPSTMERNRDRGETGSPPNWWTPRPDAEANRTRSYNSSVVPQDGPRPPKRSRPGPQSDFHAPPSKRTSPPHPASSNTDFSYIPNTNTTALPKPGLAYNEIFDPYSPSNRPAGIYEPENWRQDYLGSSTAPRGDRTNFSHPTMPFDNHSYPQQLDFNSSKPTQGVSDYPFLVPYPKQCNVPIPTTFPDRRSNRSASYRNLAPPDSSTTVFDVFDGATWGSLLDLVDTPNEV